MGQLIDRILNFGKSYRKDNSDFQTILEEEDNELKNIIDELNNSNNSNPNSNNYQNQKNTYSNAGYRNKSANSNSSNSNNSKTNKSNSSKNNYSKYSKEIYTAFIELEMEPNDDIQVIKSQYKKLIKLYHPDKLNLEIESITNTQKASKINFSYNILKNYFKF